MHVDLGWRNASSMLRPILSAGSAEWALRATSVLRDLANDPTYLGVKTVEWSTYNSYSVILEISVTPVAVIVIPKIVHCVIC